MTTAAIHMYDSNHLILGVKAEAQEIEPELIKAAAPYVNVFSIEDYLLQDGHGSGRWMGLLHYLPDGAEPG